MPKKGKPAKQKKAKKTREEKPLDPDSPARPFWSGTITFGLVSVPVQLLPANQGSRTSLRMVSPEGLPLSRRYFTSRDDRPLEWDEIVRGYEIEKNRFVVVEDDELERLAPERTRDIDLRLFVDASEVDPVHFERAYYLTPAGESTKAYRLLARVMEESGRAGIATFVMRGKEYLVAILAENGILRAETLRFADEIRTPEDIGLPAPVPAKASEVKQIEKEIATRAAETLDEKELAEPSAVKLEQLVRKKVGTGKDVVKQPEGRESRDVLDLIEILQRSLRGESTASSSSKRSRRNGKRPSANGKSNGHGRTALEQHSKPELYERAKALDIPGRGSMTKDELIDAIEQSA